MSLHWLAVVGLHWLSWVYVAAAVAVAITGASAAGAAVHVVVVVVDVAWLRLARKTSKSS